MNTTESLISTGCPAIAPHLTNSVVKPIKFPAQPQEWKIVSLRECPTPDTMQQCETPDQATEYLNQFPEADVLRFLKDPRTSEEVRNLSFAFFAPEEFPTHRTLQELMMLDPMGAERDQIMEIATLLLPWCRDGNYGCLFDGTSNLSLTGKIAHFELGYSCAKFGV